MAGPWEDFQNASGAQLAQNDTAIVAPPRAQVPSSGKVWGDAEAQAAGLYEAPGGAAAPSAGPWEAFKGPSGRPQITVYARPVAQRFGEMQPPQSGAPALQGGLEQRTLELTRGPEASPVGQMAGDMSNLLPAASQGTSPHVSNYGGQIVSTEVLQDDAGNIQYRDPQTGEIKPTDNSKHVALRDPADGRIKIFNRTEATNEGPLTGVSRVLGPGLAVGAPTARAAISATPTAITRASDIFSTAKAPYRAFDAEAGRIPVAADEAKNMVDRVQGALDAAHLPSEVAKQVHDTVALLAKKGDTTLTQLQYVKRAVGKLFKSPDSNIRDGAAVATKEITRIIGEVSPTAAANLQKGDAIHSTARSVRDLQNRGQIAGLRTNRAGYGGNAINNMRTQVEKIVEAHINGRTTGFKPNEIQAMTDIVNGNVATNTLREVGSMSPTKGGLQMLATAGSMGITGALGAAANKLGAILTGKQLERLQELVAKRSPEYAKAVAKSVARWEQAQIDLMNNPAPNRLAAYVSASRALSSGLTRDGIQISSADLIRQLSGPIKSAADEQQQPVQGPPGQQ